MLNLVTKAGLPNAATTRDAYLPRVSNPQVRTGTYFFSAALDSPLPLSWYTAVHHMRDAGLLMAKDLHPDRQCPAMSMGGKSEKSEGEEM